MNGADTPAMDGAATIATADSSHRTALDQYRIPTLPPSMYYIPSFLTPTQQSKIFSSLPPHKWTVLSRRRLQSHPSALSSKGTLLSAPLPAYLTDDIFEGFKQLDVFAGSPHAMANHCLVNEYEAGQGIMMHEDGGAYWGCTATVSLGGSVVLNVMEKNDGAALDEGIVGTADGTGGRLDQGSEVGDKANGRDGARRRRRILQEPGSLLVTTGEAYASTLHGIAEEEVDEDLSPDTVANWELLGDREVYEKQGGRNVRTTRTSLTYRDVIKVSNAGSKILGFGKR